MSSSVLKLDKLGGKIDQYFNLVGIVVEFTIPYKSNGPDCCTCLKIIDQRRQDPELCINMFMPRIDMLPRVRANKDIILLYNVKIIIRDGNVTVGFYKRSSSFALYDGAITNDFTPYQTSSPHFQPSPAFNQPVRELRNWSFNTPFDVGMSGYVTALEGIQGTGVEFVDLVCKIVDVHKVSDGKWMMFVWDGTDAPALSIDSKLTNDECANLPLWIEPDPLPADVLNDFPHVRTVLRIVVDDSYGDILQHFRFKGKWLRIRNIQIRTESSGLLKGVLATSTKFLPLSDVKDKSVIDRIRNCDERRMLYGRVPSLSSISDMLTVIGNQEARFMTLMDCLTSDLFHAGYKCVVRFVAMVPCNVSEFKGPDGCYRIRVTLEDPTARLHAMLCFDKGELFFGSDRSFEVMTSKVNKLLGVQGSGDLPRNPPWVRCCVGFKSRDENNVRGSRYFVICDTMMID